MLAMVGPGAEMNALGAPGGDLMAVGFKELAGSIGNECAL